ncbi:MAG: tetratricopeptide repeat protein [Nitrospinota bacterium]
MARYKRIRRKGTLTQPDEFLGFWDRKYHWAAENWGKLLTPLLFVMLAVVIGGGVFYYTQQKAATAQNELSRIINAYPRGEDADPALLAEVVTALTDFSQRFSGTAAAPIADLYRAHTLARQGNSEEAVKLYEKIISTGKPDDLFVAMAVLSLARYYQDQGDYEKSNAALEKFSAGNSFAFAEEIDFMTAQNLELASNKKAALEKYHAFLTKYPDSTLASEAREKIQKML